MKRADALILGVVHQLDEIGTLTMSAESTAKNVGETKKFFTEPESKPPQVDDLINLKQQQASVVQAYQATKQGEETLKQGKAIMLFTVMTIIFVSLLTKYAFKVT
jgi:hypothetical protein